MRALFLNHNVVWRGTFQRASCLARELVREGHEVSLVTTSRSLRGAGHEWEWEGVRIIEAPDLLTGAARTGWDPWNVTWRTRRLANEQFDLIHAFDCRPVAILPALSLKRRTGAPLFIDWADWWGRGGTIQERSGWAMRTMFGPIETWFEESFRTDAVANTTINDALRERCISLGVPAERVLSLPNGCAPPFDATTLRPAARAALVPGGEPLVLHLGVMQKADATFLFEAFRRVRGELTTARLALVGPYVGTVPDDLRGCVTRTGFVDADVLRMWLAASDIGVIPLRDTIASRGRWPGKISDYLEGGLPIIMPDVGTAAKLIARAGAGRVTHPSPEALADTMVAALRDPDTRRDMSARGRQLAAGPLSWSSIATRLLGFYEQWSDHGQMLAASGSRN
jgi:glycosyltransferase involved in cell wall biosynthesis